MLLSAPLRADDEPVDAEAAGPAVQEAPARASDVDDEAIRKQVEEILAQPEFRRVRMRHEAAEKTERDDTMPKWLRDWVEWFFKGQEKKKSSSLTILGSLMQIGAYAVLAIVCGLIVWLIVSAIRDYQRRERQKQAAMTFEEGEGELSVAPSELPADAYVARAQELAAQGLYREAIGQLLLGAMSHTERAGRIRYRRGLTYRDYLRAWQRGSPQQSAWRALIGVYEPIGFGRRPAGAEHFETSLGQYEAGFRHA
ncbi:MAG TPA: DUF4129 domain-containing protein [Planctomycetaceae bacterium]|nr:DUF4129 domain-containing protein [Planctomycetaceae bacterium]